MPSIESDQIISSEKVIIAVVVSCFPVLLKYNLEAAHNGGGSCVTGWQDRVGSTVD
jgi:hypothetical protein